MGITDFSLEVKPHLPQALERLWDLANNLIYSWNQPTRALFCSMDRELWTACRHNPKLMLRRIDQKKLESLAKDQNYLDNYQRQLEWYDNYIGKPANEGRESPDTGLVVYFCAEYGFHESLPIYSGGLGILAADLCKAASDQDLPLVAVGLLYRNTHTHQTIDAQGWQVSKDQKENIDSLPVEAAVDQQGREVQVSISIADRELTLKVWQVRAGRISLYLLDSDLPINHPEDRGITGKLYASGKNIRILQEMVLGIGGVRALRALNLIPQVWHINEGHAAFLVIERIIDLVRGGLNYHAALEQVAGATVFTLHTPIAAGHDVFDNETVVHFLSHYLHGVDIEIDELLALGATPRAPHYFSMTSLALRGSRFHNGVSRIHSRVASEMEQHIWPQIPVGESPMGYITNGIHIDTFMDREWQTLLGEHVSDWQTPENNQAFQEQLHSIDDSAWWQVHNNLKQALLDKVLHDLSRQHRRNGLSEAMLERSTVLLRKKPQDILVMGFARRFATYKRATLIFSNRERLAKLVNDPEHPVLIIFAGKAHADDESGKELIKKVYEHSLQPEFIGKIIMLEGYDMSLARRLVSGCDVWLNTPKYPMEACGTSGQKAGVNGVVNLSIKDGWWGEGYSGNNGWAVTPHDEHSDPEYTDRQEAMDILDIIEHQLLPCYFDPGEQGYPIHWIQYSKASMHSILRQFSAQRMLREYVQKAYIPAARQQQLLAQADNAARLAQWKKRIAECWDGVGIQVVAPPVSEVFFGEQMRISVQVRLNGLQPEDLAVDCLLGQGDDGDFIADSCIRLHSQQQQEGTDTAYFILDWSPEFCGLKQYRLRMYPWNELLSHPFETGYMRWV